MKAGKNPARAMALLALAKCAEEDAGASACLDLEEIAAMVEPAQLKERLSWEQRRRITRHLAVCPDCYHLWLDVARQAGGAPRFGWPFSWRWPRLSFKTLAYAGGTVAAVAACLLLFVHPQRSPKEINPAPPASIALSMALPAPAKPAADANAGNEVSEVAAARMKAVAPIAPAQINKQADVKLQEEAKSEQAAGEPAAPAKEKFDDTLADKHDGNIHIGAVEVRRSGDQLAVWYGDLREMCHQPGFVPSQWTSLYARGADILEALPEDGQDEEIDRLWLILGQMEGLTAERRQSFCAWSEKELAHKQGKKERK